MSGARRASRSGDRSAPLARAAWSLLANVAGGDGVKFRRFLGTAGIVVFVGPNGSGKSLLCVESILPTLDGVEWACDDLEHLHNRPAQQHVRDHEGCPVLGRRRPENASELGGRRRADDPGEWEECPDLRAILDRCGRGVRLVHSTLPLLLPSTGLPHPLYRPLQHVRDLVGIEHADVLFDEVAGVSDASDSATMPAGLTRWLQQLRKRDVFLRITTPAYDRCSKPIRQVAQVVVDVRSFFPGESESGRLWRPRRAMLARAYDAFEFGTFNKSSGKRMASKASWFYWRADHDAMHHYSTLAQVNALVDVTETGICTTCNGSRSRPKCECPTGVDQVPADRVRIEERVTSAGARYRRAVVLPEPEQGEPHRCNDAVV